VDAECARYAGELESPHQQQIQELASKHEADMQCAHSMFNRELDRITQQSVDCKNCPKNFEEGFGLGKPEYFTDGRMRGYKGARKDFLSMPPFEIRRRCESSINNTHKKYLKTPLK